MLEPTDISLHDVVDLYLKERRRGNLLTLSILERAFPHLAGEIREKLPAIMMIDEAIGQKPERAPTLIDDVLGGCKIVKELGRGAMGVVYEALQEEMHRRVALKVITLESEVAKRFILERQAMARLEHPNIVPVYSSGRKDDLAYLVMKLIDGKSLDCLHRGEGDILQQAHYDELRRDWRTLGNLGAAVANGLHHAHMQGMVHRDIKPGNLILDRTGKIWIIDFGLARLIDHSSSLSRTGDVIGTPRYMAPEQSRGLADARSDVYSLGTTLYELVTGEKIWENRTAGSLVGGRDKLTLPDLREFQSNVPEGLAKIIMKACQFDPNLRYQTADEMCLVLSRLAAGIAPADRRRGKRDSDEVFRKKLRQRTALTIGGGAGIVFIIGATLLTADKQKAQPHAEGSPAVLEVSKANQINVAQKPGLNLIDKLADTDQEDMVQVVLDFVDDSIKESTEQLRFSEDAERRLIGEVQKITNAIKEDGLDKEKLNVFLDGYRKSALPSATKIMRVSHLVSVSGFTEHEKEVAIGILQQLASAVANKAVPHRDALRFVNKIAPNSNSMEQFSRIRVSDDQLRQWFGEAQAIVAEVPPELRVVDWNNSIAPLMNE
ncbi:serine/threonine protein kinase [Planctomycetaceae bacterium SH139]